jgi:hypothetical protein
VLKNQNERFKFAGKGFSKKERSRNISECLYSDASSDMNEYR